MERNVEQHQAFNAGAEKFKDYTYSATPANYDGEKLKSIIDDFGPALTAHLSDEIQTLLSLDKYGGEKLEKAWHELDKKALDGIEDKVFHSNTL